MFQSGLYLRRRYNEILGNKYSPNKIYILSTDTDRAITSAQANMAGLFMPNGDEIWNENLLWQPIPVHTLPTQYDTLLHGGKPCPNYKYLYKYFMERSPEALELMETHRDLIEYWAKMSGKKLKTIEDVTLLHKNLVTDQKQHKKLVENISI